MLKLSEARGRERKAELPPVFMASAKNHKKECTRSDRFTQMPRWCVGGKKCQNVKPVTSCVGEGKTRPSSFLSFSQDSHMPNLICHVSDAQRKKEGGGQAGATFLLYVCKIEFGRDDLKRECQRCQHNISLERIHPSLDTLLVDSKQLLGLAVAKILRGLHSRELQLISV